MQERWTSQVDQITSDFKKAFGTLTMAELNWKPDPKTWSIAQNIDHLMVINGTYHPVIIALRAGTYRSPFLSRFNFMVSFLGRTILKSVQPDRMKRMKTFPLWEPAKSDLLPGLWERFEKQQAELKSLIQSSSDLLENGAVISSPANTQIVYKLETAFDIIVSHERRHFEQAREVDRLRKNDTVLKPQTP